MLKVKKKKKLDPRIEIKLELDDSESTESSILK